MCVCVKACALRSCPAHPGARSFALGVRERSTETSRRCEPFFSYTSIFFLSVRYCTSVRQSVSDRDSRVREPYCAARKPGVRPRSTSRSANLEARFQVGTSTAKGGWISKSTLNLHWSPKPNLCDLEHAAAVRHISGIWVECVDHVCFRVGLTL